MKRIVAVILMLVFMSQLVPHGFALGEQPEISSPEEAIQFANQYMNDYMNYKGTYFHMTSKKGKPLNKELALKGNSAFNNLPIFVYGDARAGAIEGTKYGNDKRVEDSNNELRAIGFSYTDEPYPNPKFHIDNVTYVRRWIKNPWELPNQAERQLKKELLPDNPKDKHITQWLEYTPNQDSSSYSVINQWVQDKTFTPTKVQDMTGDPKFFNKNIEGLPKVLMNNPQDYVYMIQPPTYYSWGVGIAFYYYGGTGSDNMEKPNNYLYYQYFRYKPFSLLADDLMARFEKLPTSATAGEPVSVAVTVNSTFKENQKTDYKWSIKAKDGSPLEVVYSGHSSKENGEITIPGKEKGKGEVVLQASFTMPESDVSVAFSVNDKKKPAELSFGNNKLNSSPDAIKLMKPTPPNKKQYDLDYNVLSKKAEFGLNKGQGSSAALMLPRGYWSSNATGSFNVTNRVPDLFRDFQVQNNPPVNDSANPVVRKPMIQLTLKRPDFGDHPANNQWLEWANPYAPKSRTGQIAFNGEISRDYKWTETICSTYTDEEGEEHTTCHDYTHSGSTSGSFVPGADELTARAFIYNGMDKVPEPQMDNKVVPNSTTAAKKQLWWKNETYPYKVVRWMAHEDASGQLYDWTQVNGKHEREFTHQAKGEIAWKVNTSIKQAYQQSREAARKKKSVKSQYDHAVFATDKELQKHAYPIKSGYYFNPEGKYTLRIETTTYKQSESPTKDHQDLVEALVRSFNYETNLVYINQSGQAVNLNGEILSKRGSSIPVPKAGQLNHSKTEGVNGTKLLHIEKKFDLKSKEIPYTHTSTGFMHAFWKMVLEGYAESSTQGKMDHFKYREYVKAGQKKIYELTEVTEVTFELNPSHQKLYTHANMPNGEYDVKTTIGDINLTTSSHAYKKLGKIQGVDIRDENTIKVTVVGSMYDDLNN